MCSDPQMGHSEEFWQNVINCRNHPSILGARTPWTVWLSDWTTTYSLTLHLSHQHCIPRVFLSSPSSFPISFIGVQPASLFESIPTYSYSLPFSLYRYFPKQSHACLDSFLNNCFVKHLNYCKLEESNSSAEPYPNHHPQKSWDKNKITIVLSHKIWG